MRVSRSDGLRCDFSTNKLTISMSNMSFCNFNSKSEGRRYDFFFHLNTTLSFPPQNLVQRLRSQTPSSVSSTPSEVSAILCEPSILCSRLSGCHATLPRKEERCVTSRKTAAKETIASPVLEKSRFLLLQ